MEVTTLLGRFALSALAFWMLSVVWEKPAIDKISMPNARIVLLIIFVLN